MCAALNGTCCVEERISPRESINSGVLLPGQFVGTAILFLLTQGNSNVYLRPPVLGAENREGLMVQNQIVIHVAWSNTLCNKKGRIYVNKPVYLYTENQSA